MFKYKVKDNTPLHKACKNGQLDMVSELIKNGADVNAKDAAGWTPLHDVAGFSGNIDIVRLLIENGADVNAETIFWKDTPVSMAWVKGRKDVVKLLKNHGGKHFILSGPVGCIGSVTGIVIFLVLLFLLLRYVG